MDKLPAFQYAIPLNDDGIVPHITFELSEIEYAALGRVSIQWSFLEHVLSEICLRFYRLIQIEPPEGIKNFAFKKRLQQFNKLISLLDEHELPISNLQQLHKDMAKAAQKRNKLIHGIWDYNHTNPFGLEIYGDKPEGAYSGNEDLDSIYQLSIDIGFLNFFMIEMNIDGEKISDLPRTGVVYGKDGELMGHMHRSMMLSSKNQDRLYPNMLPDTKENPSKKNED
ncbi:hypothetical protein [Robiginitomaculum antarcticum]|uniref:hypothetical protein n=1 Tax=Robiginitomaculum antarcticum TaxID=437507 RepID=UPI0003609EFF|nr:hypothetical protein [Robiginitomaculum antarcticum]